MHFRTITFIVPISRIMICTLLPHIYLSICPLLLFLLRWWLSVHLVKRTTAMPTFNSNLFHCASRCLLWFDSTLLCLMLVSLFHISSQFGFQFNSDKLYETSALCCFCFPQIKSDLLWTSIPVFSQLILSFFS